MAEPIARHTITNDGQDLTKPGNQGGDLLAPLHRDWIITAKPRLGPWSHGVPPMPV